MSASVVKFSMEAVRRGSREVLTELGHPNLLPLVENGELCTLVGPHPAEAVSALAYRGGDMLQAL